MKNVLSAKKPTRGVIGANAKEVVRAAIAVKAISVATIALATLVAVVYTISAFYNRYGVFTVSVSKYDQLKQGLSLSEVPQFTTPIAHLSVNAIQNMTNISGDTIPANIDSISGDHSGENYLGYTFYVKNTGQDTVTYDAAVVLSDITNGIDEAIRIEVYKNGKPTTYAKVKKNGTGPEPGTTAFLTGDNAMKTIRTNFKSGDVDRYTVVMWIEGNDPDCVDAVIGGRLKMDMQFNIVESG